MRTVLIRMANHQLQRFSCDQLLAGIERQLPTESVQQEVEQGTALPFSNRLVAVTKREERIEYIFKVTFKNFMFRANRSTMVSYLPSWLLSKLQREGEKYKIPLNESKGLLFSYSVSTASTTLSITNLKIIDKKVILPNIYDSRKLCFGQNNARPVDCNGDFLKEVETAINIFLGGTFNRDLSMIDMDVNDAKQRVVTFLRENCPNLDILRNVELLDEVYFVRKLFLMGLASVAKIDLVKFSEVIKGRAFPSI